MEIPLLVRWCRRNTADGGGATGNSGREEFGQWDSRLCSFSDRLDVNSDLKLQIVCLFVLCWTLWIMILVALSRIILLHLFVGCYMLLYLFCTSPHFWEANLPRGLFQAKKVSQLGMLLQRPWTINYPKFSPPIVVMWSSSNNSLEIWLWESGMP